MPINAEHPFKGRHFQGEVIVLCVRWYLRYRSLQARRRASSQNGCRGGCQAFALGCSIRSRELNKGVGVDDRI